MKDKLPGFLKGAGSAWGRSPPKASGPPKKTNEKKTPRKDLEAAVQKECLSYLRSLGIPIWRQNSGRVRVGEYYIQLAPPGASDLVGILPDGKMLCVELKRRDGKGRQTEVQKGFQKVIERNNGIYILACSAAELGEKLSPHMDLI